MRKELRNILYINNIMSANRSVLAAQRRRAGPTNAEPGIPGRGPQPSINSSQMFASQGKSVQGLKQQPSQQQQPTKSEGLSSVSKMTIPQAITLITLRLGSLESKLMNMQDSGITNNMMQMEGEENMVLIDKNVIQSITSRLESLEKRSSTSSGSASGPEVNLLKQQVESIKQAVIKTNSASTNLAKDNKDLKIQVENLKTELTETKELLQALQNITMDNSQKLMNIPIDMANNEMFVQDFNNEMLESVEDLDYNNLVKNSVFTEVHELNDTADTGEIVTGNLKKMIENEINSSI
jgi:hypothetical protein